MTLLTGANAGLLEWGLPGEPHYDLLVRQWRWLDGLLMCRVLDRTLTAPPGSPADGDVYIPATGATGAWSGHAGKLARWSTRLDTPAWEFTTPKSGWRAWDVDTDEPIIYLSSAWGLDGRTIAMITGLQAALDDKLDAVDYQNHFKGKFTSAGALTTAHPTASYGDYAVVDAGIGSDPVEYLWDDDDGQWAEGASVAGTTTDVITEGSSNLYFTQARVRSTALTGLGGGSSTPITGSDSLLTALANLQAQITVGAPTSRQDLVITTASLAANAYESDVEAAAKSYRVLRVATDIPARVRLYDTTASRDADIARPVGDDPVGDHGLILEVITTSGDLSVVMSPQADGSNMEATPVAEIPYTITNLSGSTDTVAATITYLRTE